MELRPGSRGIGLALFAFLLLTGCAGNRPFISEQSPTASGSEALATAQGLLKTKPDWNIDCTGFVRACYHSAKMTEYLQRQPPGRNLAHSIFRYCTDHGVRRPRFVEIRPGDILIFDKTYDANHDGHIDENDRWTHAGIAESFENGLLTYLDASRGRKGKNLMRRSFSIRPEGKNERVAIDPATGRRILHRETFNAAFGLE